MNEDPASNNAQTPEQKREIIERLYQLWLKHPEMRLGELFRISSRDYAPDFRLIDDMEWLYGQEMV